MCSKHKCLMSLWVTFWIVSLAMLIIGAVIVTVVNNVINNAVSSNLPINLATMSASDYNSYVNTTVDCSAYIWNITNLQDVLATGAIPELQQVGPVNLEHWFLKSNLASNFTTIQYNAVDAYYVKDASSQSLLNSYVYTPNLGFLAGVAAAASKIQLVMAQAASQATTVPGYIGGTWYPTSMPQQLDDGNFNAVVAGTVLSGLYPVLQNSSQTFLTALRGIFVPFYFQSVTAILVPQFMTTYSLSASNAKARVLAQWMNSTAYGGPLATQNPSAYGLFAGFELPVPLSDGTGALAAQLWNPQQPCSLANNFTCWSNLANSVTASAAFSTLLSAFSSPQISRGDIVVIASWIASLSTYGNTNYESVCMSALQSSLNSTYSWVAASPSDFAPMKWADVGAFQFGTGMFESWNYDVKMGSTGITGTPRSLLDDPLIGPSFKSMGVAAPFEVAVAVNSINPALSSLRLSIANSTLLLNVLSGVSPSHTSGDTITAALVYRGLYSVLSSLYNTSQQIGAGFPWQSAYTTAVLQVPQVNPLLTPVVPLLSTLSPLFSIPNFGLYFYLYINAYWGHALTGPTGVSSTGLFTRITVGEILFGTTFLGNPVPGVLASWKNLVPSIYNPTLYSQYGLTSSSPTAGVSTIQWESSLETGRLTEMRTGRDSLDYQGQYVKYFGVSSFQTACQYNDPGSAYACSTPQGKATNDYQIWGDVEVITGTTNGLSMAPFKEGRGNIVATFSLFVEQLKRVMPFSFSKEYTFKGINLRRYNILPDVVVGKNNSYRNDRYRINSNTPDGIMPVGSAFNGLPLYASKPHCLDCDKSVWSTTNGQKPKELLHETNIDVEPLTGKTMNVDKRLQALIRISKNEYTFNGVYSNVFKQQSTLYIPVYWVNEHGEIKDDDASKFVNQVYGSRNTAATLQAVLIALGVIGMLAFLGLMYFEHRRYKAENSVHSYNN